MSIILHPAGISEFKGLIGKDKKQAKEIYRNIKKHGIRGTFLLANGVGLWCVVKELAADGIICQGKRYLGSCLMHFGCYTFSGGAVLVTNFTTVVKYSKTLHSICAAGYRCAHNLAETPMLICDYMLFAEPVPSCGENDYDLLGNATDVLKHLS